jgi:hypothetical protein
VTRNRGMIEGEEDWRGGAQVHYASLRKVRHSARLTKKASFVDWSGVKVGEHALGTIS